MTQITMTAGPRRTTRWQDPIGAARLRHPATSELAELPGRRGLPLIGVMPEILLDPLGFSKRMHAAHGTAYRFHAFGEWHVHLLGAEANELVLFDANGTFSAREGWGPLIGPLFPGALLVKDGPEHRHDRRLMGEAFKQGRLNEYGAIFADDIAAAVSNWSGRRIDLYPEIKALTFRIAASTFLGMSLEREARFAVRSLTHMISSLLAMVRSPGPSLVRLRGRIAKARLDALLARHIEQRRAQPGEDFLSRLANLREDNGEPLPVQAICDSFTFLLSAAHDTLASSLTSLVHHLAAHPDWADRLRRELADAALPHSAAAATAELPLLDMFHKECLRLHGPAPVVWRRAVRPFRFGDAIIPAGTMTGVNLLMTHRLPDVWPDPERFDPLRFTPEAERERSRFAYIPFGAGVHKCLGMHFAQQQARVFAAELLGAADLRLEKPARWYHWPNARPRGRCLVEVLPQCR